MKRSSQRLAGITACLVLFALLGSALPRVSSHSEDLLTQSPDGAAEGRRRGARDFYDVREHDVDKARARAERRLQKTNRARQDRAARGRQLKEAVEGLRRSAPVADVKVHDGLGLPEVVSAPRGRKGRFLAGASGANENTVRGFVGRHAALYGLTARQIAHLKKTADYANPTGNLSWVRLRQEIKGVPVFQGELHAMLTSDGELASAVGRLIPGLDDAEVIGGGVAELPSMQLTAAQAIAAGAASVGVALDPASLVLKESEPDGTSFVFERGPFDDDIRVELVYFPLEAGVVAPAWSMTLWQDVPAYYTLVDAEEGGVLWQKNITDEQTQSASYGVYEGDSPAPLSPSNALPGQNVQGVQVPRTTVTTIHEHPANNLGWLTDGATTTTGNNVDAGLDLVSPNGIDPGGRPVSPTRQFVYDFNPFPGILGAPGSMSVTDTDYRWGAVTNIFFWSNRYHDRLYALGFTEAARNFQQDNFGRNPGGATANARNGNDRVLAEAQDFSGTNNANFSTGTDGNSGRMQMFLWPNAQRDGDFDNEIVIHELTHGTSNRLHNNASGLGTIYSRGMGEGWSDFYARSLLSSEDEDVDGVYAMGAYATHLAATGYTNNYYYGIRRFPYAVMSNVGPNGRPHNPLTYADTNPNLISLTDGAFARGPFGLGGRAGATAVHNIGEVWAMTLFEVRARFIKRLGYEVGNERMLQLVTDGMKNDPVNPTLVDSRNSLLAVAAAGSDPADVLDIWAGFATRGLGYSATKPTTVDADHTESFDNPIPGLESVTFSDAASCTANGAAEPGEELTLSVTLKNPLGATLTGVTASVAGGPAADFGSLAPGATATRQLAYTVPADAFAGELDLTFVVNSNLGEQTKNFQLKTNAAPVITFTERFDGVTAPALPAGWAALVNPTGSPVWRTVNTSTQSAPNAAFVNFAATTSLSFLQSPAIPVTSDTARLTFRHSYNSEFEWDGGILQISLDGGTTYLDILDSGPGARFIENGFDFVLKNASVDGNTNLLQSRPAWTGNSNGFITTTVQLPTTAAGKNVFFRWIAGADSAFTVTNSGWTIDNVALIEGYAAATATTVDAATVQYSDQTTLRATVCSNAATGMVEFKVNSVNVGAAPVNSEGVATLPYTVLLEPKSYTITANFVSDDPRHLNSMSTNTLTVTKEDAVVTPSASNQIAVKVNAPGGTAGPIQVCADITEAADGSLGDISHAQPHVTFSFSAVGPGSAPAPGVVSYTGGGFGGTLRACTTVSNVAVNVYDVTINVGGSYYVGTGSTVLAVYDPSLGFVSGGGTIDRNGVKGQFGINVKYLKNGTAQGSVLYIEHRPTGPVKVKSNAMQSLSIIDTMAIILGKATLDSVGNYGFRVTTLDNGATGDQFGLQVTAPNGAAVSDLSFPLHTLSGGQVQVPQQSKK